MIDLSTDDGIRTAMREIASWPATEPSAGDADADAAHAATVTPIDEVARRESSRPRLLWAAVLLLIAGTVAGVAVFRGDDGPIVTAAQGTWETMAPFPLETRLNPSTLWTGTEMLVWGGYDRFGEVFTDGAAYDPDSDSWRRIADYPTDGWNIEGAPVDGGGSASWVQSRGAYLDGAVYSIVWNPEAVFAWDLVRYDVAADRWDVLDENRYDELPTDEIVPAGGLATMHVPHSITAWNGRLVVTGWRSDLSEMGWSMLDVGDGGDVQWSDFTAIDGASDLYFYGDLAGGPVVIDGRHFVFLRDGGGNIGPLGYVIDLVTQTATLVGYPSDGPFEGLVTVGIDGLVDTTGLMAGVVTDGDGGLRRFAARLQPETGRWFGLQTPPAGQVADVDGPAMVATPFGSLIIGGIDAGSGWGGLDARVSRFAADPEVTRWANLPPAPIDLERTDHTLIWTGDDVIVWGGAAVDPQGAVNVGVLPLVDGARYRIDPPEPDATSD